MRCLYALLLANRDRYSLWFCPRSTT